jgi:hypothetical protein
MSLAIWPTNRMTRAVAFAACGALMLLVAGCSEDKKDGKEPAGHGGHSHAHATVGPHGGQIIEWGDHEHHLELKFDRTQKQATVYVVDHDVKKVQPTALVTPLLKLNGVATPIPLVATPLDGETAEKSSRYVATHDALADEEPFAGALSGKVGKIDYFRRFEEEKQGTNPADPAGHKDRDHDHEKDAHKHDDEKKDANKKAAAKTDNHDEHGHDHEHDHGKRDDHPHDDHAHEEKATEGKTPTPSTDEPKTDSKPENHGDHDHKEHDHDHAEQKAKLKAADPRHDPT